jgi:tripartite-type tricarboxylate transporter receptor subunit TctC
LDIIEPQKVLDSWSITMKLPRRNFLYSAISAATLPAMSRVALALDYPTRPVRILVGFAAGGTADTIARLAAQWLSQRFGQQFIVENRTGAGTNIATDSVVHATPDGYTLLLITSSNAINASMYEHLSFNFLHDIVPVAGLTRAANVMEVNPSVPAKTVPEFIAYAKANPGKINMASGGIGSSPHMAGELFSMMADVKLVHVPYRGDAPALVDMVGGQMQVMFDLITASIGFIKAGKLRPLAVTSAARSPALPELPTVGDFLPGYEATSFQGLGAPRSTPHEIIERLNKEVNAAFSDDNFKARMADLVVAPLPGSASDFGSLLASETEKWAKVTKAANIKAE